MSLFEKIYFTFFILAYVAALAYWGNLAWFHPDKLKNKIMKRAQHNPDWLFIKGYSLKFSEKYGILMMRWVTFVGALIILTSGILVALQLIGIIK